VLRAVSWLHVTSGCSRTHSPGDLALANGSEHEAVPVLLKVGDGLRLTILANRSDLDSEILLEIYTAAEIGRGGRLKDGSWGRHIVVEIG
jgi:hypothetical protein